MKNWPLRWQITAWAAFITGAALLMLAAATTVSLYFALIDDLDDDLTAESYLFFAALPAAGSGRPAVPPSDLVHKHSEVLYGYAIGPSLGPVAQVYPEKVAGLAASWPPAPGFRTIQLAGERVRLGVFTRNGRTLLLVGSLESSREVLFALLAAFFFTLPVALVIVGAGSWWIAGRALRPVAELTRTANTITAQNLGARLAVPAAQDEISQHIRVLNEMFDRLQRSFEQAARFAADASHELRTPLTILRGEIEEALRGGGFSAEQERRLVSLLEQTGRLQKIAENLLLLARFDAGKAPLQLGPVDFSALVAATAEDAELLASPARLKVGTDVTPGLRLSADELLLRRLLLNLIDNAVRYNRPNGEVRLSLTAEGGTAVLRLGNTGPGIPAQKQAGLFQRFFRVHDDRNRSTGGSGLGLSLCQEIVTAHGGQLILTRSDADWTEFTVRLSLLPA